MSIQNPILRGFHADPCLCRKGGDFYLAVSSFEWCPGIPVYHSKDLKHWELYTHLLKNDRNPNLRGLPSAKGIWAPCLTYCETEDLFYLVYGVMNNMNARYFDIDNFLTMAKNLRGEWSEPVYLHSAGFDASLFHDDNGKKWLVSLDWETRDGYDKPGEICIAEYDAKKRQVIGMPKRIWRGSTDRGCLEGPHLYKHGGYYYLFCAEGGTGYGHCATAARSKYPDHGYEPDPEKIILSSHVEEFAAREDTDHLRPRYACEGVPLQKAGHGSIIETPDGETYMAYICARPFFPELRCTMGRETGMQKMYWSEDGWLRACAGKLVSAECEESSLPDFPFDLPPARDDFEERVLPVSYYSPRIMPYSFIDLTERKGWIGIRGQESAASCNQVSFLAKKIPSIYCDILTKMEFAPESYHHSAGLALYYDNMNFIYLQKYVDEKDSEEKLCVLHLENGVRTVDEAGSVRLRKGMGIILKLELRGRAGRFLWGYGENELFSIGDIFDVTKFSDEYCKYGEFTGTFAGMLCWDSLFHRQTAWFDFFELKLLTEPEDWQRK